MPPTNEVRSSRSWIADGLLLLSGPVSGRLKSLWRGTERRKSKTMKTQMVKNLRKIKINAVKVGRTSRPTPASINVVVKVKPQTSTAPAPPKRAFLWSPHKATTFIMGTKGTPQNNVPILGT